MEETKDGFVLDCSVTMAWCFDDEATPYTDGVRDCLAGMRAVVPSIWPLEVANADNHGRTPQAAQRGPKPPLLCFARSVAHRRRRRNRQPEPSATSCHLARTYQLSAYDACLSGAGHAPWPAAGLPRRQTENGRRRRRRRAIQPALTKPGLCAERLATGNARIGPRGRNRWFFTD